MTKPAISLILSCSVAERQVRACIEAIQESQPVSTVELFLVHWDGLDYTPLAKGFFSVATVTFPRTSSLNVARTVAARRATADIVVVMEDHTHITGEWVVRLPVIFAAHNADAVGWTIVPMDRSSHVSWVGYLVEYGIWGPGATDGLQEMLPGHNCAYRRSALFRDESLVEDFLQAENFLHTRIREQGGGAYFTTEFTLAHSQFHSFWKFIAGDFLYGWGYAATRTKINNLGPWKRLFYLLAIPLKVPVRWLILLRAPRDPEFFPRGVLWKHSVGITLGYLAGCCGEIFGYLFGAGQCRRRLTLYEIGFDRLHE